MTVLTVDDQAYFRGVMRAVVDATEGFTVVGEAASGEEALDAVGALAPSLVIIDKRMPGIGGVEACGLLSERYPGTAVLIVSIEDQDPVAAECCGTASFLRKQDLSPRALRELWRRREALSG